MAGAGVGMRAADRLCTYAFDILAMAGDDLRPLPLYMSKLSWSGCWARRSDGITVAPFERGEIGPDLLRAACRMALRA